MKLKNAGFSLLEILVAGGLAGGLALTMGYVISMVEKQKIQTQKSGEALSDTLLAKKMISMDLSHCGASYNVARVADDSGTGSLFDFIPDRPCKVSDTISSCKRQFTLKEGGTLWFLLSAVASINSKQQPAVFDPAAADINGDDHVTDDEAAKYLKGLDAYPKSGFLLFYSPVFLRAQSNELPSILFYLGQITSSGLPKANVQYQNGSQLIQLLNFVHPTNPLIQISTLDLMMTHLPMAGGPVTITLVKPVKLVRYQILKGVLSRGEATDLTNPEQPKIGLQFTLAPNVEKVVFSRDSLSSPVLSFSVKFKQEGLPQGTPSGSPSQTP